jgi:predicted hydrocarbon binding protein
MMTFMDPISPAYPNKLGRLYLTSLEEALRHSGYVALLNWVDLADLAGNPPPDNWAKEFDYARLARLDNGLTELYGPRGGQLATRAGQRFFERGLKELGLLVGVSDLALRAFPVQTKLKLGLTAVARLFTQSSDQNTWLEEQTLYFTYHVQDCPLCWQREAREPICHFMTGMLQEAARWFSSGQNFRVRQISCQAMGQEACVFQIDRGALK